MGKIIDIKCNKCKEEFTTMPYFCNTDIYIIEMMATPERDVISLALSQE